MNVHKITVKNRMVFHYFLTDSVEGLSWNFHILLFHVYVESQKVSMPSATMLSTLPNNRLSIYFKTFITWGLNFLVTVYQSQSLVNLLYHEIWFLNMKLNVTKWRKEGWFGFFPCNRTTNKHLFAQMAETCSSNDRPLQNNTSELDFEPSCRWKTCWNNTCSIHVCTCTSTELHCKYQTVIPFSPQISRGE